LEQSVSQPEQPPFTQPVFGFAPQDPSGTLAEQLFHRLSEAIMTGELPLGSKISEPALAKHYGVSRGPLREALHRLQERKLITRSANQGARVIQRTPEMLYNLFIVREALEGMAVREAVSRCSVEEIRRFRESVLSHEAALKALPELEPYILSEPHQDFHYLIVHASRNPLLIELLCSELYPLLRLFRVKSNETLERREKSVMEHKRILSAIEERDAELAEMLLRRHIAGARMSRAELFPANVETPRTRQRAR
jgi:DNA-binding GntR family transcriptional regulator